MIKPYVADAPGLTWKRRKAGWEARWQAQSNIIRKGWPIKSRLILRGLHEPLAAIDIADIQSQCQLLQNEMQIFNNGEMPWQEGQYSGTLRSLIDNYLNDKDSSYHKIRYNTRSIYANKLRRLEGEHGHELVREIKARTLKVWHQQWTDNGLKISAGHSMIGILRTLMTFGGTILDSDECLKVKTLLSNMRFEMGKPREERLTAQQVEAIRAAAHAKGRHSIALAQALQFECMLRQKDCIGEWIPISEGPLSDIIDGNKKWLRGLRWSEIDKSLILRHVTSKRGKKLEVDLSNAPMVVEELNLLGALPTDGPVIVSERTGLPYDATAFRRQWRDIANSAGIPKKVRNMDTRAGAISEATDAGAELEHVRHASTHGDISMVQRYSRGSAGKIATVQNLRAKHRTKPVTDE